MPSRVTREAVLLLLLPPELLVAAAAAAAAVVLLLSHMRQVGRGGVVVSHTRQVGMGGGGWNRGRRRAVASVMVRVQRRASKERMSRRARCRVQGRVEERGCEPGRGRAERGRAAGSAAALGVRCCSLPQSPTRHCSRCHPERRRRPSRGCPSRQGTPLSGQGSACCRSAHCESWRASCRRRLHRGHRSADNGSPRPAVTLRVAQTPAAAVDWHRG